MNTVKKLLVSLLIVSGALLFAEKTPIAGLEQTKLDNGLTIFTAEDHSVPLVYIEIAVRAGGTTQSPETAGLFHLYEHMMFKGNDLYPDASSVQKALNDMGCTNWNGTTGNNYVNYFVTVPADQLENALAFWNAAIRSPLMNEDEFENEKKVVLSEIEGGLAEPDTIYVNYIIKNLFPDAPYRLSPGGESSVVKNASIGQMLDMKSKYYIPKNAALFIGGDIKTSEAIKLCKKIWGNWQNNGNEAPATGKQQSLTPFSKIKYAVMANEQMPKELSMVDIEYRGADADFDLNDSYALDYLLQILNDPDGTFSNRLVNEKDLQIPDSSHLSAYYGTSRADALISFEAYMLNPEENISKRVAKFNKMIQEDLLKEILKEDKNFSDEKRSDITRKLTDENLWARQTATGLLNQVRFWWAVTGIDYYYDYNQKLSQVSQKEAEAVIEKYISNKAPLVTLVVNPQVLEENKDALIKDGFEIITGSNAFWWQNEKYKADPAKIAAENAVPNKEEIYKPKKTNTKKSKIKSNLKVKTVKLKNGIPLYVSKNSNSDVVSLTIALKGGISHITEENAGLEDSLFTMMASSSQKYSWAYRKSLAFDTHSAISSNSSREGSSLTLSCLNKYLDKSIDLLVDGFLNPSFEEIAYSTMMTSLAQNVQAMTNDPQSILDLESFKSIYKNHPYKVSSSVTPESIKNISIENMKALHKNILKLSDIFIVATGNINEKALVKELNKSLGSLQGSSSPADRKKTEIPSINVQGPAVILTHPAAAGTGYVYRYFASPSPTDSDYIAAKLAANIYSTVLFNVARIHYGVCYSPGSFTGSSFAPLAAEYLFKMSDPENFISAVAEARDLMAAGKIVDKFNEDSSFHFTTIEDVLQGCKNSFINSSYSSYTTASGLASLLTNNLLKYNDASYSLKLTKQIQAVSAGQILDVFKKYWVDQEGQWWLMVGPEMEEKIKF